VTVAVEAVGFNGRLVRLERGEGKRAALADAPRLGSVREDAEDPRLQRRAPLEAIDPLQDGEPGLLCDLLGDCLGRHVHPRNAHEHRVVHLDQRAERGFVARTKPRDE
jgi:hypothetical protein